MRQLTSFDHLAIAKELLEHLRNRHFQKLSLTERGYKVKFRGATLLFLPPDKLYKTDFSVPSLQPDRISLRARALLSGKRLEEVKTLNLDRVVVFDFGDASLVFELFREGNILLLEGGKIVDVLRPGEWKDRKLLPGEEYAPPPHPPISRGELLTDSFLVRDLIRSGVPKPYAKEIIYRLGADEKQPTKEVNRLDIEAALNDLLEELSRPAGFLCDNEPYPIRLSYLPCEKRTESFNALLDTFTPSFFQEQTREEQEKPDKLFYMERALSELEEEIKNLEGALQEIYLHWSEIEEMFAKGEFKDVGKLRYKGRDGKDVVFDFTP